MQSKGFWYLLMMGSIGLWVLTIVLGYRLFPDNTLLAWSFFMIMAVVHALELVTSSKLGKEKDLSTGVVVAKTMLYGFTWWLPLKRGIVDK